MTINKYIGRKQVSSKYTRIFNLFDKYNIIVDITEKSSTLYNSDKYTKIDIEIIENNLHNIIKKIKEETPYIYSPIIYYDGNYKLRIKYYSKTIQPLLNKGMNQNQANNIKELGLF